MCGIAGILRLGREPIEPALLARMSEALAHRGPDESGEARSDRLALASRRLAMRDGEAGRQPWRDGEGWLAWNGEIYNRAELAARFGVEAPGEAALIMALYRRFGRHFPRLLVGMFALALWDERRQRLLLARDRSGMKPLHYYQDERFLLFASELKALLHYPRLDRRLSPAAVEQYLRYSAVLDPDCIYARVAKVAAGSVLVWEDGRKEESLFAERPPGRRGPAPPEEVRARLRQSVAWCLRGEAPLGLWLSGGVDSSGVAAQVVELQGGARTFSAACERKEWDEGPYSQQVARHLGTDHRQLMITEGLAFPALERLARHQDEPLGDSSLVACSMLAEFTRQHGVKGVLTGDGGDELFGGYSWHGRALPYDGRLQPFLDHAGWSVFPDRPCAEPALADLDRDYLRRCSGPEAAMCVDERTFLRSDLLVKIDRATMQHGLEARLPFLNHPLARFASSLSGSARLEGGAKGLLKRALAPQLPASILERSKLGFSLPIGLWLWKPGPFRQLLRERLDPPDAAVWQHFPYAEGSRLLAEHDQLPAHGQQLWALLLLQLWLERETTL